MNNRPNSSNNQQPSTGGEPPSWLCPPNDLWPILYTSAEGEQFQLWTPEVTKPNCLLWSDGRRWDVYNGFNQDKIPLTDVEYILEAVTRRDEVWYCTLHERRATHLNSQHQFECSPDLDLPWTFPRHKRYLPCVVESHNPGSVWAYTQWLRKCESNLADRPTPFSPPRDTAVKMNGIALHATPSIISHTF